MLHKITIENFFSIADKQEISFGVHKNAPDLPCFRKAPSCDQEERLPTCIAFFGANASGKSTILRAITSLIIFALQSFDAGDEINFYFHPYMQEGWLRKPSKIMIEFDAQLSDNASPAKFRYELHISHNARNPTDKKVFYEALFYAPKGRFRCLFERQRQDFSFGQAFGIPNMENDPRKELIRPNASVLSTLIKLNHPQSSYLGKLIRRTAINTNIVGFGRIEPTIQWLSIYVRDAACRQRLNRELRRLDIGLESMVVESHANGFEAKFKHTGLDHSIPLWIESSGTQRFVEIFPRLHYALKYGSVAIIDELDTDFHALLLGELFRWFNDPDRNPHGAQLIFSAHNPAILDDLEKEQIFFVEKPTGKPTYVYGARDIKGLRRNTSLMKKYLSGVLGGVPHIG